MNTIKTHMAHIYRKLDVGQPERGHHPGPSARTALTPVAGDRLVVPVTRADSPLDHLVQVIPEGR